MHEFHCPCGYGFRTASLKALAEGSAEHHKVCPLNKEKSDES